MFYVICRIIILIEYKNKLDTNNNGWKACIKPLDLGW